jgi:hypothetical protein
MNDELQLLYGHRLTQLRLARLTGSRPKVGATQGTIEITCTFGLSRKAEEPKRRMAKLELELTGIPKDAAEGADPAFTVAIEVRGLITFAEEFDKTSAELEATLFQPLYVFAAQKTETVLAEMGVRNIRLDPDIRTVVDRDKTDASDTHDNSAIELKVKPPKAVGPKSAKASKKKV